MLEEIASLMELLGEDGFRVNAHTRAARAVEGLSADVSGMDAKALRGVSGIGEKIAAKIEEFCRSGRAPTELAELRSQVPKGLLELLEIPGLGPKTARVMWKEGGITTKAGLEKAIASGAILKLPRMGEKSVEKLKQSMEFMKGAGERMWLAVAAEVAAAFVGRLAGLAGVASVEPAGSLRRGKETIGDVDILVALKPRHTGEPVAEAFCATPGVEQVLVQGEAKCSVRYRHEASAGGKSGGGTRAVQVDLRVVPTGSFGAALMYFTGSKEHNVRLRERALKQGLTLNEWGLYPEDDDPTPPQQRGVRAVAGRTEEEIYAKLGLPWIAPEIREDRGELELKEPAGLIELKDVRAELHAHTRASDGSMELDELAERALERGFHTLAVTDHSKSSVQANGLSVERLLEQVELIASRKRAFAKRGLTLLAGSEVDILGDGSLDYEDKVLAKLDIVVASPHVALSQEREVATKRLLRAIAHPRVHILGHPTGRMINRRAGLDPDIARLCAAAKEHGVALEINAHWIRLDLRDTHVRAAMDAGCLVAINCDTHAPQDMDNLRYGVATARRGWCPASSCINTWSAKKLTDWLAAR